MWSRPVPEAFTPGFFKQTLTGLHRLDYMSSGKVKAALQSPAHFEAQYILGKKKPETPAMKFGTLAHKVVLEGSSFLSNYIVEPEFTGRTKDGNLSSQSKEARDKKSSWYMDLPPGRLVVSQDELDQLHGIATSLLRHDIARNALTGGRPELAGYAIDPETGTPIMGVLDFLRDDGIVVEVKTTKDASKEAFARDVFNMGYYIQLAMYMLMESVINSRAMRPAIFIAIEKVVPYTVKVYTVHPDNDMIRKGLNELRHASKIVSQCLALNQWPGAQAVYNGQNFAYESEELSLPPWAFYEEVA